MSQSNDTAATKSIRIGHTPDADDAFMFYGFASRQANIPEHEIEHVLHDIEMLNALANGEDPLEVTALSLHAFLSLSDRYEMLNVGSSVGRGYGPKVVTATPMTVEQLAGRVIALPGERTTATLAARLLLPPFEERHMTFTDIPGAVLAGDVDVGVLIHEAQLTYQDEGLHLVCDLGTLFAARFDGLPLPLGVNCVRRDLAPDFKRAIADAYTNSVQVALDQRADAIAYSARFGRGAPDDLLDRFVGMYVNEDSLSMPADVQRAVAILADAATARRSALQ